MYFWVYETFCSSSRLFILCLFVKVSVLRLFYFVDLLFVKFLAQSDVGNWYEEELTNFI